MLSIIYVSSALREFSDVELVALLQQSREKNIRLDITGMLLYKDGNFMQALEGPDDAVRALFATIRSDERHRGVILLLEQQIEQRSFSDWTMGFQNLSDPSLRDVPGYDEFMNEPLNSEKFQADVGCAHHLLQLFRQNMNR